MKRLALALALLAAPACGKKDKNHEDQHAGGPPPAPADAAAAAKVVDAGEVAPALDPGKRFEECLAAFNKRDVDILRGCYAPDATADLADSPPVVKGVDEILA